MNRAARTYLRRVSRLMCCSGRRSGPGSRACGSPSWRPPLPGSPLRPQTRWRPTSAPPRPWPRLLKSLPLEEEFFRQTRRLALLRTVVACLAVILICSGLAFLFWLTYDSPVIDLSDLSFYTKGI